VVTGASSDPRTLSQTLEEIEAGRYGLPVLVSSVNSASHRYENRLFGTKARTYEGMLTSFRPPDSKSC